MAGSGACLAAVCLLPASLAGDAQAAGEFAPPGPNVALGKSYALDPAPDCDVPSNPTPPMTPEPPFLSTCPSSSQRNSRLAVLERGLDPPGPLLGQSADRGLLEACLDGIGIQDGTVTVADCDPAPL